MSLSRAIFVSILPTSRREKKINVPKHLPTSGLSHNRGQTAQAKIKYVQPCVYSVNVYAKFAAGVMASDCNLLKLQMMPRKADSVRLKSCHLHDRRLRARYSISYV